MHIMLSHIVLAQHGSGEWATIQSGTISLLTKHTLTKYNSLCLRLMVIVFVILGHQEHNQHYIRSSYRIELIRITRTSLKSSIIVA